MAIGSLNPPVRLVGDVRDTLNDVSHLEGDPADPQIEREDLLALAAGAEAQTADMEQRLRGNPGHTLSDRRVASALADFLEQEQDTPDAEPMDEDELDSIISRELAEALGANSDELQGLRANALNYYFGRKRGDEKPGRSELQSLDVADMVESVLAQALPSLTSGLTVEFEQLGNDQALIKQAQDESLAVDYIVQKENRGFLQLYSLVKDALLLKNGVAKVYLDESREVQIEEHQGVNAQGLLFLQQPRSPREEVVIDSVKPIAPGVADVTIKRIVRVRKIRIEAVPPDELRVNSDHNAPTLETARFACHERIMRESELIAMDIDPEIVADIPSYTARTDTTHNERAQTAKEWEIRTADKRNRPLQIFECWMLVDFDGDGLTERRRVLRAGNGTILVNEPVNYMGLISGAAYINPHKWVGISLYDKLKFIQDYKTHFLRQGADNANAANNARMGFVKGQVNEDHLFNSVPGGGVALKRPDALVPINTPNVLPAVFTMLDYGDKMRTERAGASLDMQSKQVALQNRTAYGAERVIGPMEQVPAMITQTIVETLLTGIYLTVHQLLREYFPQGYAFPQGGTVQQVQPGAWQPRSQVTLKKGLSVGERGRMMGALERVFEKQMMVREKGGDGTLVTDGHIYQTMIDYARMAGLPNPGQYWMDPMSQEGQQAAQAKQQQAQQQRQEMMQQQQMVIELQREVIHLQEETKRIANQTKAAISAAEIAEDQRQHTEDTANEITEMELKYNQELPGGLD